MLGAILRAVVSRRPPSKSANNAAELLPDPQAVDKLSAFFDSLGNNTSAAVSLYAVDPANRLRRSFLLTIADAAELTGAELMAQVLERFGPGEYFAESRDETSGQVTFAQRFEVGAIGKRGVVIPPAPQPPAAAKPGDISAELIAMMARQTAALEALAAQRQPPSMVSMLRELKELRDVIAPPPASPAFDIGKLLELVNGVATLRDTLGDGDGGGPFAMIARSLAPALQKIAERAVDAPAGLPAPPPAARPEGEPVGVTDSPPATPAEGSDMAGGNVMLKVYVAELIRFAEQGLDPAAATQRVVQTLAGFPESVISGVLDWLNDEAVVDNLTLIDPKAAQYRQWLEQVIDGVLDAALEPAAETPPATPPTNGGAHPRAGG